MNQQIRYGTEVTDAAQLRQAFDSTFATPQSLTTGEIENLLMIRIAGDPYAIRLLDIAEIISGRSVVSVPTTTPDLLGLAGVQGGIVPVFSLSSLLGYGLETDPPRWMIICGSEEPFALGLSDFEGHLKLPTSALHTDENFRTSRENVKYVTQVARTPNGVRAVISIPLIMATMRNRISQLRPTKESKK